ncbi:GNAT family N-acetyltransferase [Dyella tabacisoli]|uniref:GNAT family N-acetyltransferase n=1 Tax=Dyella tabacisoli TaxID=2282381 RepID=A0A369UKT3_9GAMM|nr:GNAT family N-acetyltransferase [Dyella tabacisoli]RDD80933.1 GNAT family N-acetyltransferase [Dyella tabacisoli]
MSHAPIHLRSAHSADAGRVVPLLVEAMDHVALQLAGVDTWQAAVPLFVQMFEAGGNRYSHEYVLVMEIDGDIAGALLAYPGRDEAALAKPVLALLRERDPTAEPRHDMESALDEFYLDALTVAPAHRGGGHAARLIEAACEYALEHGHTRAGLLVDLDKPRVKHLYQRLGFAVDGERMVAGHRYEHMVRHLHV